MGIGALVSVLFGRPVGRSHSRKGPLMAKYVPVVLLPGEFASASRAIDYGTKARAGWFGYWYDRGNLVPCIVNSRDGIHDDTTGAVVATWSDSPALPRNIRHLAVALAGKSQWTGHESSIPGKDAQAAMTADERDYWQRVGRIARALQDSANEAGRPVVARPTRKATPPAGGTTTATTGTPDASDAASRADAHARLMALAGQSVPDAPQTPAAPTSDVPDKVATFNAGLRKIAAAVKGLATMAGPTADPAYVMSEIALTLGYDDMPLPSVPDMIAHAARQSDSPDPAILAACEAYVARFAPVPAAPKRTRKPRAQVAPVAPMLDIVA